MGGADGDGGDADAFQELWSQDPVLRVSQPTCLLSLFFFFNLLQYIRQNS